MAAPALPAAAPLGPDSLLGRVVTDPRIALTGFTTGVLQLMHPAVSAAVVQHSAFFDDPFDRVYRSVPRIVATVVAPDGAERAVRVRDYHRDLKGLDAHGKRYHALDPETFWWTHMCFVWGFLVSVERFHHGRWTRAQREQYYAETVTWWRRYGLTDRFVSPDLGSFLADFERRCADLEWTEAAEGALATKAFVMPFPAPLDRLLGYPATPVVRRLLLGAMPADVRRRFDLRWTPLDQAAYAVTARAVRDTHRVVPGRALRWSSTLFLKNLGARTQLASEPPGASLAG